MRVCCVCVGGCKEGQLDICFLIVCEKVPEVCEDIVRLVRLYPSSAKSLPSV